VDSLVVGDIVEVQYGDRIPADIRLMKCSGFKVRWMKRRGPGERRSEEVRDHGEGVRGKEVRRVTCGKVVIL